MRKVAIVSGKGGVGKTTIAVNLCVALKDFNKSSVLLDANLNRADASVQLGFTDYSLTLNDVMRDNCKISDSVYTIQDNITIIPSSIRQEKIKIKSLKEKMNELNFEYMIIDSAPGMGKEAMFAMKLADDLIVVTTPDIPAVNDALRVIELSKKLKKKIIGIVLNRVKGEVFELTAKEIETMCNVPVICSIPEDEEIYGSIAKNVPLVLYKPNSNASIELKNLAVQIGDVIFVEQKPSFFQKISRFFKFKS